MKQNDLIKHFKSLTPTQILAEKAGRWGDYELLDVLQYFAEKGERERETAVTELILRSPENSEMVAYDELYFDLAQFHRSKKDFPTALHWFYALLAYDEQHESGAERANHIRDIAETYLDAGDFDTGLTLMTRRLQTAPGDIWTYNSLGITLPRVGLNGLALEALDRALALTAQEDPENIRDQLEDLHQSTLDKADDSESHVGEIDPAILASFRAALQLPVPEQKEEDAPEPYLPPVDRLIELGSEPNESRYAEILVQGKALAPDLIRMAFDESLWETAVPVHAVALLRRLQADMPELTSLTPWLERADGDWPAELLTERMGKVGGYTTPELEAFAADTSYYLYVRSTAAEALIERVKKFPDQRERVIHLFRTLLTRPEAYEAAEETFIGFLIGDIADMGARELYDEIKQAYDEDRVDPTIIGLPHVHKDWGLAPLPHPKARSDGLDLLLQCKACGRERFHFVQHVLVDVNTREKQDKELSVKYDAHIMDREIICPKCQAVDQYELTTQGHMRLYMHNVSPDDLLASLSGKKPRKPKPNPYMTSFRAVAFGRTMHPLAALEKYRQQIEAKPDDALLHMRLGNLLRTLRREAHSLAAFRQAQELAPENVEICLTRGMAEHDYGDRGIAKAMYENVMRFVTPIQMLRQNERAETAMAAAEGLKNLKRGKASPYELQTSGPETTPPSSKRKIIQRKQRKKKRRRR